MDLTLNTIRNTIFRWKLHKSIYDPLEIRLREKIPYFSNALQIIKTWMNNVHRLFWVTVKSWVTESLSHDKWTWRWQTTCEQFKQFKHHWSCKQNFLFMVWQVNSRTRTGWVCKQHHNTKAYAYMLTAEDKVIYIRMWNSRKWEWDRHFQEFCFGFYLKNFMYCLHMHEWYIGISPESFELCVQHKCHTTNKEFFLICSWLSITAAKLP